MRTLTMLTMLALMTAMIPSGLAWEPDAELPADPTPMNVGPFAGVLQGEGASGTHTYQNVPSGMNCIQITQPYRVHVATTPGAVEVTAAGHTQVISGTGSLYFERGVCTVFDIVVENVGGGDVAYAIEVTSGPSAGSICNNCIAITA